jgi:hypothetical protein
MKTILLNFAFQPMEKPQRARIEAETYDTLSVRFITFLRDAQRLDTLTKQADGTLRNQYGCVYVIVKADRRPKPFAVTYNAIDGRAERAAVGKASITSTARPSFTTITVSSRSAVARSPTWARATVGIGRGRHSRPRR